VGEETSCENSSVCRQTPFCKAKRLDLPRRWVIATLAEMGRGSWGCDRFHLTGVCVFAEGDGPFLPWLLVPITSPVPALAFVLPEERIPRFPDVVAAWPCRCPPGTGEAGRRGEGDAEQMCIG